MPIHERLAIVSAIEGVDQAIEFNDNDGSSKAAIEWVRLTYPNAKIVFANGGDRTAKNIPEMDTGQIIDDIIDDLDAGKYDIPTNDNMTPPPTSTPTTKESFISTQEKITETNPSDYNTFISDSIETNTTPTTKTTTTKTTTPTTKESFISTQDKITETNPSDYNTFISNFISEHGG